MTSVACLALQHFSTFSHKRNDFRKKKVNGQKCVFWFSLQVLTEIFLILRSIKRDIIKNIYWSSCKVNVCPCHILTNLEFSRQNSEKYSNIKFTENPSSRIQVVPWADTHDEAVPFRNFASPPKNQIFMLFREVITAPRILQKHVNISVSRRRVSEC